jgi:hypothetical protein
VARQPQLIQNEFCNWSVDERWPLKAIAGPLSCRAPVTGDVTTSCNGTVLEIPR